MSRAVRARRSDRRRWAATPIAIFLACATLAVGCAGGAPLVGEREREETPPRAAFDRVIEIVLADFVFPERLDEEWRAAVASARETITPVTDDETLVAILDGLLRRLGASHTRVLGADDPESFALRCVFSRDLHAAPRPTIGIATTRGYGTRIVTHVLDGSPAARAGVQVGDVITHVDGADLPHPVRSFRGKKFATLSILRVAEGAGGTAHTIEVVVENRAQGEEHLAAQRASQRMIERDGVCIGVVHLWSGTHPAMEKELARAVASLARYCDGFILDLRGGFGGAHPRFLAPFYPSDFLTDEETSDAPAQVAPPLFGGPLIALIDGATRSGKEWLANTLSTTGRATLVGERTAGAFLGGRFSEVIPGRVWLYLAVVEGPEGIDLEGKGQEPAIVAPRDPRDPARDRALEVGLDEVIRQVERQRARDRRPRSGGGN